MFQDRKNFNGLYSNFILNFFSIYSSKKMTDKMFSDLRIKARTKLNKFSKKNEKVLETIKEKTPLKDLTDEQYSIYTKESSLLDPISKARDKEKDSHEMYFIRLWLEFESYQIELLTNFLLANEDSLKSLVTKLSKKKKTPGLKSSSWTSYFKGELNDAGKLRHVRDLVSIGTRGGVIDRQNMFSLIGVKISGIENESTILLQKIRNMIIHEKAILSNDILDELRAFNKKYASSYNKNMRKIANRMKEKNASTVEDMGLYRHTDDIIYRTFKDILKNVNQNKKNKKANKLDFHSIILERFFKIILKDFFSKTYQILKLSDFDFTQNEKKEWDIISFNNQNRQEFFYQYLTSFGDLYKEEYQTISNTRGKEAEEFQFLFRGLRCARLFAFGKSIFLENPIINKDGKIYR